MKFVHLLGIAGVDTHENVQARKWAKRLEWPMLAVALWIPFQWYLEESNSIPMLLGRLADWLVWLVFLTETLLLTSLVKNKRRYLIHNWMNLLIIVGSVPLIWHYTSLAGLLRSLRLFMVVVLLVRMSRTIRQLLSLHQLGTTLSVAVFIMVLSGIVITRIDPSIGSIGDGMWWAWVTMATVGYGDVVPHNGAGRLFGSFLILFGVLLMAVLTANLSAFFIDGDVKKVEQREEEIERSLADIAARLERIEKQLDHRKNS